MTKTFASFRAATKRGLTLIEALLFLGIAAVVIVGAVLFYNNASNSARTNDALTQINVFSTGIKGLHSGQPNYGTAGTSLVAAAINGGVAPRNTVNGTALLNPWGGATTIATGTGGAYFIITMNGLPQDSCVRILTAGLLTQGGIFTVRAANATTAAPATAPTTGAGVFTVVAPPTPASAALACVAGAGNQLAFYVR